MPILSISSTYLFPHYNALNKLPTEPGYQDIKTQSLNMLPKQLNFNTYQQSADSKKPIQQLKKTLLTVTGVGGGGGGVAKLCPTLATPWIIVCQASLTMGFSRQDYWSGLPFPSPGDVPDPGTEPGSPAPQADSLQTEL